MTGEEIVTLWNDWDGERSTIKNLVQEAYHYCLPRRATVTTRRQEGVDVHSDLCDSTAERANERFATGLYNFMWNPARTNFMLLPPMEVGFEDTSKPLLAVTERLKNEMGASNFEEAFYELALDWGAAGLATLEPSRGLTSLFEFTAHPFEQVVFAEDRRGRVDTVLRKFRWTARQIVQEFGSGVPREIREAASKPTSQEKSFDIVHAALPRTQYTTGRRDVLNMPVASVWVEAATKTILRTSGWPEMRYLVSRFTKGSGEKHGRSPAMTALPDIKMVNRIEKTTIVGAESVVYPPILVPDGSFLATVKLKPGSLLWYRVNALNPTVKPEPFTTGARVDFGVEYAESKRTIIKGAFLNDLFLILSDEKRRTATEVRSILAEKLAMLGPAFGRTKVELFDPMVGVMISILSEVPSYLAGLPLELLRLARIRYISTLAIAMQYAELSLIEDAMLFLHPLGELDPTIFDHFSFDEIVRGFLQKMAWPSNWLRDRDAVAAMRARRIEHEQADLQRRQALEELQILGRVDRRPELGSPAQQLLEAA